MNFLQLHGNKFSQVDGGWCVLLFSLILSFGYHSSAFSQSAWFWQNPLPQGNTLHSVKFVNAQTGFAAGNVGTILKTNNAGESWSLYNSNFSNDIFSLAFTDADKIFAVGSGGLLIKTTNSGAAWERFSIGTTNNLRSIYFFNSSTGYITGSNGKIFKSTDGGNNWFEQTSGMTSNLNCVYFLNTDKGFIGADFKLLRTTNGGNNWTVSDYPNTINSMSFINDNTGFSAGNALKRTTNGGSTWINISLSSVSILSEIQFVNSSTGFISGVDNIFYRTTNNGVNWILNNTITENGFELYSVYFQNAAEGFLAGTYGTIFKSTDTGSNWTSKAPTGGFESISNVKFPSQNTGYTSGNSIYKTTNGGNTWMDLNAPISDISGFQFLNDLTGYAQPFPELYKTQDGGVSWNKLSVPNDSAISFQFVDANTGFLMNSYGPQVLNKTTNGGFSWSSISFVPDYLAHFQFPLHDIGFSLIGYDTISLYKTTNTGENWNYVSDLMFDSIFPNYRSLQFIDEYSGFIFSYSMDSSGYISYFLSRTSNGGSNWHIVFSETVNVFSSGYPSLKVDFKNINTGYIIGFRNKLLKSTDQGENWNEYTTEYRTIYDIEFTDDNTGYIVGEGGLIKKTTNGGVISIENISSSVPSGFTLKQNYPNPFNPNTIISYELPNNNFVTLKVFDLLGKELLTLINEHQKAGNHNIEFKGENLSSGIYFYKLIVNDFSQTRKMVLLK